MMKDGERTDQRTFMHNPWTQTTTIWELAVGGESVRLERSGEREKKWEL